MMPREGGTGRDLKTAGLKAGTEAEIPRLEKSPRVQAQPPSRQNRVRKSHRGVNLRAYSLQGTKGANDTSSGNSFGADEQRENTASFVSSCPARVR